MARSTKRAPEAEAEVEVEVPTDEEVELDDDESDGPDAVPEAELVDIEAGIDDDESSDDDDEDSKGDTAADGAEAEALDELEAEELDMLTEDEASEVIAIDEQEELRRLRREAMAMESDAEGVGSDEFVCQSCFLVKRVNQLADRRNQICRDCAT